MTTTPAMPAEMLARIWYKNDATGTPIMITTGGSTDGSVFFFVGSKQMQSNAGPTFDTVAAIVTNCYTRDAIQTVSGASAVLQDCPVTGAIEFLAQALNGYKPVHDNLGAVQALSVESAADADCLRWNVAGSSQQTWTVLELVGFRYCDDTEEQVRANIFRNVTQVDPARNFLFGLDDPGTGTVDLNLTCKKAGTGWGDGPNDLFALYDDTGGATLTRDPITLGFPIATDALWDQLVTLCSCDSALRGVPLTDALVVANAELQTDLILSL